MGATRVTGGVCRGYYRVTVAVPLKVLFNTIRERVRPLRLQKVMGKSILDLLIEYWYNLEEYWGNWMH